MLRAEPSTVDERGSLVVALGVMVVLAMLSVGLLARTASTLTSVRRSQDFSAALAAADNGLADAVFHIDQGTTSTFTGTNGATFRYTATRVATNEWLVQSRGEVAGVPHGVEARLVRDALYPYAIFTNETLDLNGNTSGNIVSYNPATPGVATGHASIGSNNAVMVNGGGNAGDRQDYYVSCSGCSSSYHLRDRRSLPPPVAPPSGDTQACPVGGTFTGSVNGMNGRPFLCNQNVVFSGAVSVVSGPLIIYVGDTYTVDMTGATINDGAGGRAKNFQLLKIGTGQIEARGSAMRGVLYAPEAEVRVNGGQWTVDGSITLSSLRINGGPNFSVEYEDSVQEIVSTGWEVIDYREIPSSSVP